MDRRLALLAALVALLVVAGCGGAETTQPRPETVEGEVPTGDGGGETEGEDGEAVEGDPAAGKDLFAAQGCGSCHTLADAGTSGTIGPNLDESSATFDAAATQIANGGGGMPAYSDRLSEEEIANLAAYVVQARG